MNLLATPCRSSSALFSRHATPKRSPATPRFGAGLSALDIFLYGNQLCYTEIMVPVPLSQRPPRTACAPRFNPRLGVHVSRLRGCTARVTISPRDGHSHQGAGDRLVDAGPLGVAADGADGTYP